jgi:hypothetical protein
MKGCGWIAATHLALDGNALSVARWRIAIAGTTNGKSHFFYMRATVRLRQKYVTQRLRAGAPFMFTT